MNDFLRRLKLIEDFQFKLEMEKADFIELLRQKVDKDDLGLFSDFGDILNSSENDLKGLVDRNGFILRRRLKRFEPKRNTAIAKGRFSQLGRTLQIDMEVHGLRPEVKVMLSVVFLLLAAGSFAIIFYKLAPLIIAGFLLLQMLIIALVVFFVMRRGMKTIKREIEEELTTIVGQEMRPLPVERPLHTRANDLIS